MATQPVYNYQGVGTSSFDPQDPSVMGRVTEDTNAASTNEVNIWMRGQPWYQDILAQNGGNANSDAAKAQIVAAAQAHGVQIDQSNVSVDNTGNLKVNGMSGWEKGLIIAGVAAATIATMGAAGVFDAAAVAAEGGGDAAAIDAGASLATEAGLTTGAEGAAGALGTIPAVAGSTGGLEAGSLGGALAANSALPSTGSLTSFGGLTPAASAGSSLAPAGAAAGVPGATGPVSSQLQPWQMAGNALSGLSKSLASNAGTTLGAEQNQENIAINSQAEQQNAQKAAWQRLNAANYALNQPPITGTPIPSYAENWGLSGTNPAMPNAATLNASKPGAWNMANQANQQLSTGSALPPNPATDFSNYGPGTASNIAGYGATLAGIWPLLSKYL